jgi:SAM-dependent methyltransferase
MLAAAMDGPLDADRLNSALRVLAKWRSQLLLHTIMNRDGTVVQTGPFAGMEYPFAATEGAGASRLLGCYEASLAPVFEVIVTRPYRTVIDVGCAEGYYAVGLARRMPQAQIIARDANPIALQNCAKLAAANDVADRITLGGLMQHQDFDICTDHLTLVVCDIEGAEADLLDPTRATGLRHADILVETHDCITPGLSDLIYNRFSATHDIQRFERILNPHVLPAWMHSLSDLDRLLALWEWRTGPTPWLWMTRKEAL